MDALIIVVIAFVVIIALFLVLVIVSGKSTPGKNAEKEDKDGEKKNEKSKSNGNSKLKREDVFKFMDFDNIMDDMIVQNKGKRYTMAIRFKGVNYDLMSEVEQMAVEEGFITFLNTLKYPIQLYVQAQNIDLKGAVATYKENIKKLDAEYKYLDKEFNEKNGLFNVNKKELADIEAMRTKVQNVYEYAEDIIDYVEKMSINKNLLQRNFYVLVSYHTSEIAAVDKFSKDEVLEMCSTELLTRCRNIIGGLSACSVTGEILNSNELADLIYGAYNRDDKGMLSVREATASGFYRLYSTSYDAFARKRALIEEAVNNEARLRAIESIERAIENREYKTTSSYELEAEEEITNAATDLIKKEKMDPDIKEDAYNDIIEDFRDTSKDLHEKIEIEIEDEKQRISKEKNDLENKLQDSIVRRINEKREQAEEEEKREREERNREIDRILEQNRKITGNDTNETNDSSDDLII